MGSFYVVTDFLKDGLFVHVMVHYVALFNVVGNYWLESSDLSFFHCVSISFVSYASYSVKRI